MSVRPSHFGLCILGAVLAVGGLPGQSARAQGTQRSKRDISSSETNTADIFRSLNQLGGKENGLRHLEEELSKSSSPFSSSPGLDSSVPLTLAPLPVPTVSSRRKKDNGRSDGWLSNPNDSMTGSATEDYLGFTGLESDGKDLKRGSWEAIYKKLKQDGSGSTGLGSSVRANARQPADTEDDSDLPGAIKDNADKLKKKLMDSDFGAKIFSPTTPKSSFSDFFGVGATGLTPEQVKAHKTYMDNYMTSVFGEPSAAVGLNAVGTSSSSSAKGTGYDALGGLPTVSQSESFKPSSGLNPSLSQATLPNLNAGVLNQWNPMYAEPKLELPKPQPFFTAPIEAPRRKF